MFIQVFYSKKQKNYGAEIKSPVSSTPLLLYTRGTGRNRAAASPPCLACIAFAHSGQNTILKISCVIEWHRGGLNYHLKNRLREWMALG